MFDHYAAGNAISYKVAYQSIAHPTRAMQKECVISVDTEQNEAKLFANYTPYPTSPRLVS